MSCIAVPGVGILCGVRAPRRPRGDLAPLARPAAVVIHARQRADVAALCGAAPGSPWTDRRSAVTCDGCKVEIAARLARREGR